MVPEPSRTLGPNASLFFPSPPRYWHLSSLPTQTAAGMSVGPFHVCYYTGIYWNICYAGIFLFFLIQEVYFFPSKIKTVWTICFLNTYWAFLPEGVTSSAGQRCWRVWAGRTECDPGSLKRKARPNELAPIGRTKGEVDLLPACPLVRTSQKCLNLPPTLLSPSHPHFSLNLKLSTQGKKG